MGEAGPFVAYLADGKLYLVEGGRDRTRLIESPFVQEMLDRQQRSRQRFGWQDQGMMWQLTQMRIGLPVQRELARPVRLTGVARGADGELLYSLQSGAVGGLFAWTRADGYERRIIHRNEFRPSDITVHAVDATVALSLAKADGCASIATMSATGRGVREVTEGDSMDQAPAWAPGVGHVLVYQSAGVGRNAAGMPVGQSPYAIMRLDLDAQRLDTLVEREDSDLLLPKFAADGALWFIRRPYAPLGQVNVSLPGVAKDIVLFPIRTVVAIVHFLNWFSLVFSRKPLLTAGGPQREPTEARYMMLWGKLIDAQKAMDHGADGHGPGLVPRTWQLVRRAAGGQADDNEQVIAHGVLAFDIAVDGSVVYSDGLSIVHRAADGTQQTVCKGHLIERIACV